MSKSPHVHISSKNIVWLNNTVYETPEHQATPKSDAGVGVTQNSTQILTLTKLEAICFYYLLAPAQLKKKKE